MTARPAAAALYLLPMQPLISTYLSAGNDQLDLAASGAHELVELGADTGEEAKTVVLG